MDSSKTKNEPTHTPVQGLALKLAKRLQENPSAIWELIPKRVSLLIPKVVRKHINLEDLGENMLQKFETLPPEAWIMIEDSFLDLLDGKPGVDDKFLDLIGIKGADSSED